MSITSIDGSESDIDWYNQELLDSKISDTAAGQCGFKLQAGRYLIPYYDMAGTRLKFTKARHRNPPRPDNNEKYDPYQHEKGGKDMRYTTVVPMADGTIPPYWPPIATADHMALRVAAQHQLWIVEGEKKAVSAQCALLGAGIAGSVVAIGGVGTYAQLLQDLDKVTYHVEVDGVAIKRRVVVALDWNVVNVDVQQAELALCQYFQARGAAVLVLRWPVLQDAGEQKIDNWLAGGGDIEAAIKYSEQLALDPTAAAEAPMRDYNTKYGKMAGDVVNLKTGIVLPYGKMRTQLEHERVMVQRGKKMVDVPILEEWSKWPDVRILKGFTFHPWGLDNPDSRQTPEILDSHLNLFVGWPELPPWEADYTLWTKHLKHLFPDPSQRAWVSCWVASMVLRPELLCATYLVLSSKKQGTGKGLFAQGILKLLGGYFVKAGTEQWKRFNGDWAHALLVWSDELRFNTNREQKAVSERIKDIVGSKLIKIEGKGKDSYTTQNYMRLLFTTNSEAVVYLDTGDRRAAIYDTPTILPPEQGKALSTWLESEQGMAGLMCWANSVDLTGFNPAAPAPMTIAKRDAIAACASEMEVFVAAIAEGEALTGKDVYTIVELMNDYHRVNGRPWHSDNARFSQALRRAGLESVARLIKVQGTPQRLTAVRRAEHWEGADNALWIKELGR